MCTFRSVVQSQFMISPTFRRTMQSPSSRGKCVDEVGCRPIPIRLAGGAGKWGVVQSNLTGSIDINYLEEKRDKPLSVLFMAVPTVKPSTNKYILNREDAYKSRDVLN